MRLKCVVGFLSVVAVYAPTNVQEEESSSFYLALQEGLNEVVKRDMLIVMGDFNARVGTNANVWKGVIGRQGVPEVNENGLKLLSFCSVNNLVVTNTIFKHRDCHKFTWFHPGDSSKAGHVIDFILVNRKFRNSILDSRVYRGTHLQSDHRLVVAKIRVKFKVMKKRKGVFKPGYVVDTKSLSRNQCEAYEKFVKDESKCEMYEVEMAWSTLRKVLLEARRVLPIKVEQKSGDWVTEDVCKISDEKQRAWLTWKMILWSCHLGWTT